MLISYEINKHFIYNGCLSLLGLNYKIMKTTNLLLLLSFPFILFSCVSRKKLDASTRMYDSLLVKCAATNDDLKKSITDYNELNRKKSVVDAENASLKNTITDLNKTITFLKDNNNTILNQLKDLSVLSTSQAESIKKSLENIQNKDAYIHGLQSALNKKDSLNLALVMNLKGALKDVNDSDIEVKVEKGVVYISIADKLLFKSGSYDVSDKAMTVLGKVAQVLNNQPEIEFLVEGHTDNVPFKSGVLKDNWDLSVLRATAVARILQNTYNVNPVRMTAGGRGEFVPVATNENSEGKALNRRTRIVILPQLDQFFKLLEGK